MGSEVRVWIALCSCKNRILGPGDHLVFSGGRENKEKGRSAEEKTKDVCKIGGCFATCLKE